MKYIRKQEVVEVFHNTRDKTVKNFYDFIGHDSNLYRRTTMGDILVKTKNGKKFLYPDSYLIKKSKGELEIINTKDEFESLYEQAIIHFKEEKQNLFFKYPYEEFQSKFLRGVSTVSRVLMLTCQKIWKIWLRFALKKGK